MRACTKCEESKELHEFSNQRTNKNKLYAWCDPCRSEANALPGPFVPKESFMREVAELRAKAKQLRKFDDAAVEQIRARKAAGEKVPALAAELNVSQGTIYKAINGYKS